MANKEIPTARINANELLDLIMVNRLSIRELSRRERIGYSERSIRAAMKSNRMSWNMIMKICGELDLIFGTRMDRDGIPEVHFYLRGSKALQLDSDNPDWTFWTPVLDPCGFEYPIPVTR